MENRHPQPSEKAFVSILVLYTVPAILLTLYGMDIVSTERSWSLLCLGVLVASAGSAAMYLVIRRWESALEMLQVETSTPLEVKVEAPSPLPTHDDSAFHEEIERLKRSLEELSQESAEKGKVAEELAGEQVQIKQQAEEAVRALERLRETTLEEQQQKEAVIADCQQTIAEQRALIEKKQQQIAELQTKVEDLTYEVKTLLEVVDTSENDPKLLPGMTPQETAHQYSATVDDLSDDEPLIPLDKIARNSEEASIQLRRCLDIAQKITGASYHAGQQSLFKDIPRNNYALDLRRLFDSLRSEGGSPLWLYSQKENKLLFANNQSKSLLGWHPEKLIQSFPDLIHEGLDNWNQAINQLTTSPEVQTKLVLKTKSGQDVPVNCQLAAIPSGLFRNHVVAVLYPS